MTTIEDAVLAPTSARSSQPLLLLAAAGAAVSLSLGIYSKVHDPTGNVIYTFGFQSMLPMKAWFATFATTLALLQGTTAAWMWGKLPTAKKPPSWLATSHRWTGTVAFLFTLPVAYHCLWSLGFRDNSTRALLHSLFGCAFYGVFTVKMLSLRSNRLASWGLPVVGGLLVAVLVGIWSTSALWYFTTIGFPGL